MTVLHQKIPIFYFHLPSKVFMNFSCIRVYQNWRKIRHVTFPKFRASKVLSDLPINQFFYFCPVSNRFLEKIGRLGQSMIALWVEGGSSTGAVFGSSMYPTSPMKFCQNCQSTNFYFYLLSKVFMTGLHQNMTNDRAPPKYDK